MASSVYFATGFVYAETTQEDKDNNLLNLEVFNTAQRSASVKLRVFRSETGKRPYSCSSSTWEAQAGGC